VTYQYLEKGTTFQKKYFCFCLKVIRGKYSGVGGVFWGSPESSVGITTGYGWTVRVRFPEIQKFSLLHNFQTGSEAHPSSYTIPGTLSPGVKGQEREADNSPPSSTKVKKGGAIPPLPHTSSWNSA
jgi:hypothetical protein